MDKLTKSTFECLSAVEDLREILRKTAPLHRLTEQQKEGVRTILAKIRRSMEEIEAEAR